ncbi:MAG: nucleotidyltransferase family protein [Candidatus Aminicenantia bacterium]
MSWTNEDRLLLYCCRTEIDNRTKDKIIEIQRNNIEWDSFLKKARENGISAIVYFKLNEKKNNYWNIPSFIFEELKKNYYLNATKNTLIFKELGKVLEAFKKTGLQVIVLKGAALAEIVYGNLALRPMLDIDLLVKKEDLLRIDEQLKILGYQPSDGSVKNINFSSAYLTTLDYRSPSKNRPSFHIHWHFVNSTIPNESYIKNIKIENIWQDAEKANIANVETLVMAPHHLIIHLSEHAFRVTHSLSKFCFFCDINEAINFYQERLDWDRLIKDSFKFNLDRMIYLSLYFASKFLTTKIPEDVLLKLRPKRFSMGEKIFMTSISNNNRFPGLSYLVHLSMNRGLFKKMKFVGRTFFPPRQVIAQRNYIPQSKVSYIYYIRRINEVFSHLFKILK